MTPGKTSTEHARAWRAEALGMALVLLGLLLLFLASGRERMFGGVAVIAIGAYIVTRNAAAYFASRGSVKAAAARPAPVHARPRV